MNILYALIIVFITFLLTTFLLLKYYGHIKKKKITEEDYLVLSNITKVVLLSAFPLLAVMFTFVLDSLLKMFSQRFLPNMLDTLNTGIIIVSAMFLLSIFFKEFYKHIISEDYNPNLVLINYIIGCLLVITLSIFYIKDINLAISWFVILLGKFIWFDGFSPSKMIDELKKEKSFIKISFTVIFADIVIIALFMIIIKIYETTKNDYLFYIYSGLFFGMSFSGFKIYFNEKKSLIN